MTRISHLGLATVLVAALSGVAAANSAYTPSGYSAAQIARYDRNHNGVLDLRERRLLAADQKAKLVDHYDINDDRKLGLAEAMRARGERVTDIFANLDRNRDGLLSLGEARVRGTDSNLVVHYRSIDVNGDGRLTRAELMQSPYVDRMVPPAGTWWSAWARRAPG